MSALAIAHKALKGDLSKTIEYDINEANNYLYLHKNGVYFTLSNKTVNGGLTYISTVEEFNNFKGDNMTDNIYTQKMSDNGELPSSGELVQMRRDCGDDNEFYNGRLVYSKANVIWFDDYKYGGNLHSQNEVTFKPLTPPIELIDGKAYQFYIEEVTNVFQAIWSKERQQMCTEHSYFYKRVCENIQPLTLEAKS